MSPTCADPPNPSSPSTSRNAKTPRALAFGLLACLALYVVDLACVATVPGAAAGFAANVAVPFDLMVCVPAAFYLLVVRPRKLSPAFVLPVIYLGGFASSQLAQPGTFNLLAVLLPATVLVDLAVLVPEARRLARVFRAAKERSARPLDWFEQTLLALVPNERAARMGAMELAIWHYALCSWRCRPDVPAGSWAFTCHRQSGYLGLVGVIIAMLCVETTAVHLMVAQWSQTAAALLTLASAYGGIWMIGDARATALNPLLVDDEAVTVRWGAHFCERVPLNLIEHIDRREQPDVEKSERLNMAAMGAQPCWIVLREPVAVRTFAGGWRDVRAIAVSPDDAASFASLVDESIAR